MKYCPKIIKNTFLTNEQHIKNQLYQPSVMMHHGVFFIISVTFFTTQQT